VPSAKRRPRGRPRKGVPTGTWIDSDVLAGRVTSIVGPRDERLENGAEILPRLVRFVSRLLRRKLSRDERDQLRGLALVKRAPASVITRVVVGWRHGLGERDVRRTTKSLNKSLNKAFDAQGNDITGRPVLHEQTGMPMLDADGQPATHKPRSRVKLIYR
jgi:hypothetical protein